MVTELLEKAIQAAAELPAEEQNALASLMLSELAAEKRWADVLASKPETMERLVQQALEEIRAGRVTELDVNEI